ncbi:hypothetical protein AB0953_16760 [Streptomyces sp. NPDC046866]|uniref:hypothetical protein n=1 Tax=Streptomyces sp. NPDC046866 TaxID=3154921 RepID=UPI0034532A0E
MSAPVEPRQEDVVQAALDGVLLAYEADFGPLASWSDAVWSSYRIDQHVARMRATNWEAAA